MAEMLSVTGIPGEADQSGNVLAAIAQILDVSTVSRSDSLYLAGGDSLSALEILSVCEDEFGVELETQDVLDAPTFGDLLDLCVSRKKDV
jgi:acyl carrier protein